MRFPFLCTCLLAIAACGSTPDPHAPDPDALPRDVVRRFRLRAPPDDFLEFQRLSRSSKPEERTRAVEMALFHQNDDEMYAMGITQVQQPGRLEWSVAWTTDDPEIADAIIRTAEAAGVQLGGFASLGHMGWYAPRDQFFRARAALLESPEIQALEVDVVSPRWMAAQRR